VVRFAVAAAATRLPRPPRTASRPQPTSKPTTTVKPSPPTRR